MAEQNDGIAIRMTNPERVLFEDLIKGKTYYLEYGCGGSTEVAVAAGVKRIISVESDAKWIEQLKEKETLAAAVKSNRLQFLHADIGPVGAWGVPSDMSGVKRWPNYALLPFTRFDYPYDVILIDGRFRRLCAYVAWAMMLDGARLAIHDYTLRGFYSEVEKFFEVVDVADSLAVFKRKAGVVPRTMVQSVIGVVLEP